MRIGIDARFYTSASTGIGRYVYELLDHLFKIDRTNTYTIFLNEPQFSTFNPAHKGIHKVLADSPHYSLREQIHFLRLLNAAHLDVMHFTHFNAPIFYRKPSVVTIHDLTLHLYPGNKMAGIFRRLAYAVTIRSIVKRTAKVISVSEHTKKDIVEFLHVSPKKIEVLHLGVNEQFHVMKDRSLVDAFIKKMGLQQPYLLYTGVWRSHKNLVNLIRAFAILKKQYKFQGILVITGKEDPWYPEVKRTVIDEHIDGQVRFTGLVPEEDLVLLYNGAAVYVLPSLYEGFGLPVLEAFACGVPVCAAQSSSIPEICGEGNAVLFNPHDPADMAAKIASVYTDEDKASHLRNRGLKRVQDFSWMALAASTLIVYENVYASTRHSA